MFSLQYIIFQNMTLRFLKRKSEKVVFTSESWKKALVNTYSTQVRDILNVFGKFVIKHTIENLSGNDVRELKMKEYQQKVISHLLIYHFLINQNKADNPHSQSLDLVCLNVFDKLGLPDDSSDQYIELISKTSSNQLFNVPQVLRLKNRLLTAFENISSKEVYFRENQRGICLILEAKSKSVFYKSLYEPELRKEISLIEFKKIKQYLSLAKIAANL